jgi:peptide/nickel transport system permease protein
MNKFRPFPLPARRFPPRWVIPPDARRPRKWWNTRVLMALAVLAVIILSAVFAHQLSPHDPLAVNPTDQFARPSLNHPFGTDLLGRDVFSRALYGGRISLTTGFFAVVIASVPGVILGLVAGYFRGRTGAIIMRLMDMLLAFPGLLLSLTIVAMLGPSLLNVILAVGIAGIPNYTRVVRGHVLVVRKALYIRSARSIGANHWRIIVRHIFPNILGSVVVLMTVDVAWAILNASALSFLGVGVQPPTPDWGVMLSEGRNYIYQAPWITVGPGLVLMLALLAINMLGDGLRDTLDPRGS